MKKGEDMARVPRSPAIVLGASCVAEVRPIWLLAAAGLLPALDGATEAGGAAVPSLGTVAGWRTVRALLVHGLAFRDLVAQEALRHPAGLPPDVEGGQRWIASREDEFWRRLLAYGAISGLEYYTAYMEPNAAVEALRRAWPVPLPSMAALLADPVLLQQAVTAQALTWAIEPTDAPSAMAPEVLRSTLMEALAACDAAVGGALAPRWESVATPGPAAEILERWTGRPLPPTLQEELAQTTRLTLVPCVGLEAAVTVFRDGREWVVWAEPRPPAAPTAEPATVDRGRVLLALADPVNQKLVVQMASAGSGTGATLARALGMHPSTVSRHLRDLLQAGAIEPVGAGGRPSYRVRPLALLTLAEWLRALADKVSPASTMSD
jgi:DNA-binding transcriptional ArsR family regulator